jgi:type I restriction enzyme R subunit
MHRTTGKKPEDLLAEFRASYHPRIAVTVEMLATGTDVKAVECVLFMRSVKPATWTQASARSWPTWREGCRSPP